jgi:hypothetical protein
MTRAKRNPETKTNSSQSRLSALLCAIFGFACLSISRSVPNQQRLIVIILIVYYLKHRWELGVLLHLHYTGDLLKQFCNDGHKESNRQNETNVYVYEHGDILSFCAWLSPLIRVGHFDSDYGTSGQSWLLPSVFYFSLFSKL